MSLRSEPEQLVATLRTLLPPTVALSAWLEANVPPLYPGEEHSVARAVAKRRQEFAMGRASARAALSQLGVSPVALPPAREGGPQWPPHFTGSITHGGGLVLAAAVRTSDLEGIGIDSEDFRALPEEIRDRVILATEAATLPDPRWEAALFSAKESVHKAIHPLTGAWLDFLDVELALEPTSHRFSVVPRGGAAIEIAPMLSRLRGWVVHSDWTVLTAVTLQPPT
jgi:4'-phosphopantetheinyl transferase EntD